MAIKNYGIHTLRSGDSFVPFISIVKCIYLKCISFYPNGQICLLKPDTNTTKTNAKSTKAQTF